jgi:hypothetical protein
VGCLPGLLGRCEPGLESVTLLPPTVVIEHGGVRPREQLAACSRVPASTRSGINGAARWRRAGFGKAGV